MEDQLIAVQAVSANEKATSTNADVGNDFVFTDRDFRFLAR